MDSECQRLTNVLKEAGIPFEVHEDGGHTDITINASASDKFVTLTFELGKYIYGN